MERHSGLFGVWFIVGVECFGWIGSSRTVTSVEFDRKYFMALVQTTLFDKFQRTKRTIGGWVMMTEPEVSALVQSAITSSETEFQDVNINCVDCMQDFVWTVGEQVFFRDKGLQNPPKRCRKCKVAKNNRLAAIAAAQVTGVKQKIEVSVNCAECNQTTTVPFYPSQGRPVLCRSCFQAGRQVDVRE